MDMPTHRTIKPKQHLVSWASKGAKRAVAKARSCCGVGPGTAAAVRLAVPTARPCSCPRVASAAPGLPPPAAQVQGGAVAEGRESYSGFSQPSLIPTVLARSHVRMQHSGPGYWL